MDTTETATAEIATKEPPPNRWRRGVHAFFTELTFLWDEAGRFCSKIITPKDVFFFLAGAAAASFACYQLHTYILDKLK